ncbi:Response regulator receiver domain-containing protein [Blastococcus aurantiacus]|uniref:Response regulator receiver domain-containing protein n=1 Tax=Blastococcus aurantiacus TaxID=1550231 RepID=A0A1G7J2F9_9ACTN|nr:response regulator [Blastococcus aurantiacus]SDF18974.1 Response regulator receiver domain-containing protein [Blastococcus aurantiacus]
MLTALVVDADALARRRVIGLLRLGGWDVQEASDVAAALHMAASTPYDLVVTDVTVGGEDGLELLRQLRRDGSQARFLVVTADPSPATSAEAAAAGAWACLPKPVDPGALLDFLRSRTTGPAAQGDRYEIHEIDDLHDDDLEDELMDRLQEMYVSALPGRLSAIDVHTRQGNSPAVASAAYTLAGTSGQLGHPEVASICQAIAADARRGVLAHSRVQHLHALAGV